MILEIKIIKIDRLIMVMDMNKYLVEYVMLLKLFIGKLQTIQLDVTMSQL